MSNTQTYTHEKKKKVERMKKKKTSKSEMKQEKSVKLICDGSSDC